MAIELEGLLEGLVDEIGANPEQAEEIIFQRMSEYFEEQKGVDSEFVYKVLKNAVTDQAVSIVDNLAEQRGIGSGLPGFKLWKDSIASTLLLAKDFIQHAVNIAELADVSPDDPRYDDLKRTELESLTNVVTSMLGANPGYFFYSPAVELAFDLALDARERGEAYNDRLIDLSDALLATAPGSSITLEEARTQYETFSGILKDLQADHKAYSLLIEYLRGLDYNMEGDLSALEEQITTYKEYTMLYANAYQLKLLEHCENNSALRDIYNELGERYTNVYYTATQQIPNSSPLVLDLDGDGYELKAVQAGVYFDHNGNQVREKTGWVQGDDALLVIDRNGDGEINNGGELFGNNTLLANGQLAANGFIALAELDTNHDGVINSKDAAYNTLRIWQDQNADGSATGELKTLKQMKIASIQLNYQTQNTTHETGARLVASATFKYTDGRERAIGDFFFETRPLDSNDDRISVEIPANIAALPNARSMGDMPSLHKAMALDERGQLKTLVQAYASITDVHARRATITEILYELAGVSALNPTSRGSNIDARKLGVLEQVMGTDFVGASGANPNSLAGPTLNGLFDDLVDTYYKELLTFSLGEYIPLLGMDGAGNLDLTALLLYLDFELMANPDEATQVIKDMSNYLELYEVAGVSGYGAYVEHFAARSGGYAEMIDSVSRKALHGTINDDTLTATSTRNILFGGAGNDTLYGSGGSVKMYGNDGNDTLNGDIYNDKLYGGKKSDTLNGNYGDDTLDGGTGNDILNGGSGNDQLYGDEGNDILNGDYGNDILDGGAGDDILKGGRGNDVFMFGRGYGVDKIEKSSQSGDSATVKFLEGVAPEDIILKRSGLDLLLCINGTNDALIIYNHFWTGISVPYSTYVMTSYEFADGTIWDNEDLSAMPVTIEGTDGNDSLQAGTYSYIPHRFHGKAGDDTLTGASGNDQLYGDEGNDILNGDYGNDILDGGAGNDILKGGRGNDVFMFGRGYGVDKIEKSSQSGDSATVKFLEGVAPEDIILKRSGLDLLLCINGTNDALIIYNHFWTGTSVPYSTYMMTSYEFADGTIWDNEDLSAMPVTIEGTDGNDSLQAGTYSYIPHRFHGKAGDDTLTGASGNDQLYGDEGDDTLKGAYGNDILDGGVGNDLLKGEAGDDTYVFEMGYGIDTIYDNSGSDMLRIGIDALNLIFTRNNNDLHIDVAGTDDKMIVQSWYSSSGYQIERIEANDGYITNQQVQLLIDNMATFTAAENISWEDAIGMQSGDVQQIIDQVWVAE